MTDLEKSMALRVRTENTLAEMEKVFNQLDMSELKTTGKDVIEIVRATADLMVEFTEPACSEERKKNIAKVVLNNLECVESYTQFVLENF